MIIVPYVKNLLDKVAKILKKWRISTAMRPHKDLAGSPKEQAGS